MAWTIFLVNQEKMENFHECLCLHTSCFVHHLLVSNGQQFYFVFPWKLFCILKWVRNEFKIVMTKSWLTGIELSLNHKNCMRISTSDSLSTTLERGLALSKILLIHRQNIIIPLTYDIVTTLRLFFYGKYWKKKKSETGDLLNIVLFFSRSPSSIIFIQYNIVVARGTVQIQTYGHCPKKTPKKFKSIKNNYRNIYLSILSMKSRLNSMRLFQT